MKEITDINSVQEKLKQLQIPITEGPLVLPSGAMFIFIRDPDDNVIEFHQSASS